MSQMLEEARTLYEPLQQKWTSKYQQKIDELELQIKDLKKLQEISLRFWTAQAILVQEKQQLLNMAEAQARLDKEC